MKKLRSARSCRNWFGNNRWLAAFCVRHAVRPAVDFYGFYNGRKGVLYRHGTYFAVPAQTANANPHYRVQWKNPLGNPRDRRKFNHVLLHQPRRKGFHERRVLVPVGFLREIVRRNPGAKKSFHIAASGHGNRRTNKLMASLRRFERNNGRA